MFYICFRVIILNFFINKVNTHSDIEHSIEKVEKLIRVILNLITIIFEMFLYKNSFYIK